MDFAASNAKQMVENRYNKPNVETHLNDRETTKNVYFAIHCSLKSLLDQSVHCLFLSSSHDLLSCRYRNRVILQIFLEGTSMNESDCSEFTQSTATSIRGLSSNADGSIRPQSASLSPIPSVSDQDSVIDETSPMSSHPSSVISQASTLPDPANLFSSLESSSSVDSIQPASKNEPSVSLKAQNHTVSPTRSHSRPSSLMSSRSLDSLCDQGNIKFLTDFMLLYIKEDYRLNASNLFASRYFFFCRYDFRTLYATKFFK